MLKGGKDKKTPAIRLGLAKGPVKYEDILYFTGPYIFNRLSERLTFLAAFFYSVASKIVFNLTIAHFEFAILQVGIADKDIFISNYQTLSRKQTGAQV